MPASRRCWSVFDLPAKEQKIAELEKESSAPEFWNDPQNAQKGMKDLTARQAEVAKWKALRARLTDAIDLLEIAAEENNADEINLVAQCLKQDGGDSFLVTVAVLEHMLGSGLAVRAAPESARGHDEDDDAEDLDVYLLEE